MHNLWLVAKHEYRKRVSTRSFLLATFGIPAIMLFVMAISVVTSIPGEIERPVGYVDQAALLDPSLSPPLAETDAEAPVAPGETPLLREFETTAAAQMALEAGEVDSFYVVPAGYPVVPQLEVYYREEAPDVAVRDAFDEFLRVNLAASVAGVPAGIQERLREGPDLVVRSADGEREIGKENILTFVLPFLAAFLFFFAVIGSSGYLVQVVADEKENRTMEMVITSITPEQLIGGKALGLMAVSLTQILLWVVVAGVGLFVGARFVPTLGQLTIPWTYLLLIGLFFLPAYALVAGIMTAIGGAVTEVQHGQQIAGVLNLLFIAPFFFTVGLIGNPDSVLALILTLFPTTSFFTVALRWGLGAIPLWQTGLSWLILVTTALLSVWASARIFRAGMLRYGQRMELREMVAALRGTRPANVATGERV